MSAARWIICTTPDCPGKFTSFDYPDIPSFRAAVADMTPDDWRVVQGICGAMARGHTDDDGGG
jgi:hypothetical protein